MKTAEDIYNETGCNTKRDIIEAMKIYASQFIDAAAEIATVKDGKEVVHIHTPTSYVAYQNDCKVVDKQSILQLKTQLK